MVQAAPSSPTPTPKADHPSPPSRLLSKHRPRRRAAPPRQTLPPPAPTRGQPDLNLCRCCGARFPPPPPGAKPRPVRPLRSVWRIVLLCSECLSLIRSAAVCSYCLSLDNLPPEDSSVTCRSCNCYVHRHCIPAEHRTALIQPVDLENYVCIDCCPTLKPGCKNVGAREPTSSLRGKGEAVAVSKLNSPGKTVPASKCAKEAKVLIAGGEGSGNKGTRDPDLPDEKLALQLHLAMNGSQRISRSSSASWAVSAGKGKGQKVVVSARNANGDQGLCVTNMMDQLEDDLSGAEMGSNSDAEHDALFDPSVTVVLALECKGKQAQERMRGKRKGPPGTKHNGLVDRYKKYSKRNSSKKAKVKSTGSKAMPDGKDMDRDDGGKGITPMI